jgi:integration host factor subunit alpha
MEFPSMTLTKDHIASSLHSCLGLSRPESSRFLLSVLEIVTRSLAGGDDVLISGFGKFSVRQRGARRGRDPATGEDLTLEPHSVITFKCSALLKEKINGRKH